MTLTLVLFSLDFYKWDGDLIYLHGLNSSFHVDSCYESTISINLSLFSVHSILSISWSTKSILHLTCSKLNSLYNLISIPIPQYSPSYRILYLNNVVTIHTFSAVSSFETAWTFSSFFMLTAHLIGHIKVSILLHIYLLIISIAIDSCLYCNYYNWLPKGFIYLLIYYFIF